MDLNMRLQLLEQQSKCKNKVHAIQFGDSIRIDGLLVNHEVLEIYDKNPNIELVLINFQCK